MAESGISVLQNQELWDAVGAVEREARRTVHSVSSIRKLDLVNLAIYFANRGVVRDVLANVPGWPPGGFVPVHGPASVTKLQLVRFHSLKADLRGNPEREAIHTRFVADLDAIVAGKVTTEMLDRIAAQSAVVVVERHFVKGGRRLVEWRHYLPKSPDAALAYVLARLLAGRSDLRKCRLCGDFFLSYKGPKGAPRTAFCKPAHADAYRRLTVAERVRKSRARKAERKRTTERSRPAK
jgi:hypothetical protein